MRIYDMRTWVLFINDMVKIFFYLYGSWIHIYILQRKLENNYTFGSIHFFYF